MTELFERFFKKATGFDAYHWQSAIALQGLAEILLVPTDFGKTEGVAVAWAWRKIALKDDAGPPHLVCCLPMRSLVRQIAERLRKYCKNLTTAGHTEISVYQLMSGMIDEEWAGRPDQPWVLVGAQDQLLSRPFVGSKPRLLNESFRMARPFWPAQPGLSLDHRRGAVDGIRSLDHRPA